MVTFQGGSEGPIGISGFELEKIRRPCRGPQEIYSKTGFTLRSPVYGYWREVQMLGSLVGC